MLLNCMGWKRGGGLKRNKTSMLVHFIATETGRVLSDIPYNVFYFILTCLHLLLSDTLPVYTYYETSGLLLELAMYR